MLSRWQDDIPGRCRWSRAGSRLGDLFFTPEAKPGSQTRPCWSASRPRCCSAGPNPIISWLMPISSYLRMSPATRSAPGNRLIGRQRLYPPGLYPPAGVPSQPLHAAASCSGSPMGNWGLVPKGHQASPAGRYGLWHCGSHRRPRWEGGVSAPAWAEN